MKINTNLANTYKPKEATQAPGTIAPRTNAPAIVSTVDSFEGTDISMPKVQAEVTQPADTPKSSLVKGAVKAATIGGAFGLGTATLQAGVGSKIAIGVGVTAGIVGVAALAVVGIASYFMIHAMHLLMGQRRPTDRD